MALIKVKEKFQVTIPAAVRQKAHLDVGDLLEVTVNDDGILMKPKTVTDKKSIVEDLRKALAVNGDSVLYSGKTDDEIMQDAIRIIEDSRNKC